MKNIKFIQHSFSNLFVLMLLVFAGCTGSQKPKEQISEPATESRVVGNYVSDFYQKRNEGYEWVAVKVNQIADSLIISSETEQDNVMLGYFCSGGASLAGVYHKIAEPLDTTQIDKVLFREALNYNQFSFFIEVYGEKLTIQPVGLSVDNSIAEHQIEGTVVNAEAGDLNIDGFPELMIYLQSDGSGSYGSVIGYSVNNGKSMSMISMPNVAENPEIKEGYMGHDEFAIVESTFNQRFPIYKPGDPNAKPTGGTRQIQYNLIDGEDMRQLVVDKIVEF